MSLIPPTPLILSKMKYHISARLKDDPSLEELMAKLGPFYTFKLTAQFRSLENGTINELEDISDYIQDFKTRWDCIDTALNMFTRMRNHLRMIIPSPGVLRLAICSSADGQGAWSDLFLDEFPINVRGIRDEKGKELTVSE